MAFGSCGKHFYSQPLWGSMQAARVHSFAFIGDAVYTDIRKAAKWFVVAPPGDVKDWYKKQREHSDFRPFTDYLAKEGLPGVMGTWDDHDYGINNGDSTFNLKDERQGMFLDFLNEPKDSPRRSQSGVYSSYLYKSEKGEALAHMILLDNRYFHTDTTLLGEEQWEWLEAQLKANHAPVKVIAAGIQMLTNDKPAEHFGRIGNERLKLFDLIKSTEASGVVLLSGDIHSGEINRANCSGAGYPLYDMTTSGLTRGVARVPKTIKEFIPQRFLLPGSRFTHSLNYGMVRVKFGEEGSSDPDSVALEIHTLHPELSVHKENAEEGSDGEHTEPTGRFVVTIPYHELSQGQPDRCTAEDYAHDRAQVSLWWFTALLFGVGAVALSLCLCIASCLVRCVMRRCRGAKVGTEEDGAFGDFDPPSRSSGAGGQPIRKRRGA